MIELTYDVLVGNPEQCDVEARKALKARAHVLFGTSTSDSPPSTRVYVANDVTAEEKGLIDQAVRAAAKRAGATPPAPATEAAVTSEKRKL